MYKIIRRVLQRDIEATPGPWKWWTSNSFRRLTSDVTRKDGGVLHGTINRHDRHPDVVVSNEDRTLIEEYRSDAPLLASALCEALEYIESDVHRGVGKAQDVYRRIKIILQEK